MANKRTVTLEFQPVFSYNGLHQTETDGDDVVELLTEKIEFTIKGFGQHPDDGDMVDLHTAFTERYTYKAYLADNRVTFYVYPNTHVNPVTKKRITSHEEVFAFRYHLKLNTVIKRNGDNMANTFNLGRYEQALLRQNILKSFKDALALRNPLQYQSTTKPLPSSTHVDERTNEPKLKRQEAFTIPILYEALTFAEKGLVKHPLDPGYAWKHVANSMEYTYAIYTNRHLTLAYIYSNEEMLLKDSRHDLQPIYGFRYNVADGKQILQLGEKLPNRLVLSDAQQRLLEISIISQFQQNQKSKSDNGIPSSVSSETATLSVVAKPKPVRKRTNREALFEKVKRNQEAKVASPPTPLSPTKPSLSVKRLNILTDTVSLKEKVLKQIHLLDAEERRKFRAIWVEFETLMLGDDDLDEALKEGETTLTWRRLQSIHDRLNTLHQNASETKKKAKANLGFQILLADINEAKKTIRDHPQKLDVVMEHEVATISKDAADLLTQFDKLPDDRQEKWATKVEEGLTHLLGKLNDIFSRLSDDAERAMERQMILLNERQ